MEGGDGEGFADGLRDGRRGGGLGAGGVPEAPPGGEEDEGRDDGEAGKNPPARRRAVLADKTGGGSRGGFAGAGEAGCGGQPEAAGDEGSGGLGAAGDEIEADVRVAEFLRGDDHEEGGLFGKDAAVELLFFGAETEFAAGMRGEPAEDATGAAAGESFDLAGECGDITGGEKERSAARVITANGAPAFQVEFAGDAGGAADEDAAGLDAAPPGAMQGHDDLGANLFEHARRIVQDEGAIVAAPGFRGGLAHPRVISIACESAQD